MGLMFCHCKHTQGIGEQDWTSVTAAMSQDVLQCYSWVSPKTALQAEKTPIFRLVVGPSSNQLGADIAAVCLHATLIFCFVRFDKDSGYRWLGRHCQEQAHRHCRGVNFTPCAAESP